MGMRPLVHVKMTGAQSTKGSALMAKPVTVTTMFINSHEWNAMYCEVAPPKAGILGSWCSINYQALVVILIIHMPRERGRPRRGATWYAFDSRRKRQQKFEKALSIARKQRARKTRKPRTPPMAYVEEIVPEEPFQVPPEHLLFTVPDNWDPPTCFLVETKPPTITHSHKEGNEDLEQTTCYVEEEFSGDTEAKRKSTACQSSKEADQQGAQGGKHYGHESEDAEDIQERRVAGLHGSTRTTWC
jgi:hypothetical protein